MDRRWIAGLVGVLIAGTAQAQGSKPAPDPGAPGAVGLAPLRSLDDSINGIAGIPGTTPRSALAPSSSNDPAASGGPGTPVGPEPVGLGPSPALLPSVDPGSPSGGPSSMFRKKRAATTAPTSSARAQPARGARPRPLAPKADPAAMPSGLPDSTIPDLLTSPPASPRPAGRPAPYAGQVPDSPRNQASPATKPEGGRPAPMAGERPRSARPVAPPSAPRFRAPPPTAPAPAPAPVLEPIPPAEAKPAPPVVVPPPPPPIGPVDPLAPPAEGPAVDPAPRPLAGPIDPGPAPVGMPPEGPAPAAVAVALAPAPPADEPPAATPTPVFPPAADPAVNRASVGADPTALRLPPPRPKATPYATLRAASVGEEVITLHEVDVIVEEKYQEFTAGKPVSDSERRQLKNEIAANVLSNLIEMSLVLQEAKRAMKNNPKAKQHFEDFVEKKWRAEELPPLLRSTATTNEYELKKKLGEAGKSYPDLKETYRKNLLAHDFLMGKIQNKVNVDLIALRAYYNEHLKDYEQPARITWREIEVNVAKHPDRSAARKQAEAIAARLARKEDFATLARTLSDGPTASKGGLYPDMTPGGYGIPGVNEELDRLAIGKVSPIIEAPSSFHIVRVESRRVAGPLRFDEVQKQIGEDVFRRNITKARADYLNQLRARTLIRTMFDNTESDPARARRGTN